MRTKTAILSVEHLTQESAAVLRDAFKATPGIESVDFSLERSVVVLEFDPERSSLDSLMRVVLKAGYKLL